MRNSLRPAAISGLAEIADDYDYLLCDAWGVIHNGVAAYPEASEALRRFRDRGGVVFVITNAPRPKAEVAAIFSRLGADLDAFDDIVTSGDTARGYLTERAGVRIHHVGPARDLPLYEGTGVRQTAPEDAELIVCTGFLDDERETPDDYSDRFRAWIDRGLPMLCVNPDRIVERGNRLIWCAGALADRYTALGGDVMMIGKPYPEIYAEAVARFARLAGPIDRARVLAIGDGAETDLRGAVNESFDVLFVTGGIHAGELTPPADDPVDVAGFLSDRNLSARAVITRLAW